MHDTIPDRPRVAIYARYSSNLQKPSSIEDQVRLCQERAYAIGADVIHVHSDFEATATTGRAQPALDTLLLDAKRGLIDVVLVEALDRISRDLEHIHGIHKRLKFWKVRLFTLDQGQVETIHITMNGYMNSAFIDNLRAKTKRGQIGAVHAGRIPGGLCYGYRSANRVDPNGRPIRGLREIDPEQAAIVQRIYSLYANGESAIAITTQLNRENIPGPRGRAWASTTINGHRGRRTGILNQELYRGRIVYGRQEYVRDPDTGKRHGRPVPRDKWIYNDLPDLRIVDDDLWERVQKLRQAGQDRRHNPASYTPLPLTGLIRCGVCDGNMTIVKSRRYACHAHTNHGTCPNPRGIDATRIENDACSLLARKLSRHKDAASFIRKAVSSSRDRYQKLTDGIDDRKKKISRLLAGIENGTHSLAAHKRILDLEHETAAIEIERDELPTIPEHRTHEFSRLLRNRLATLKTIIATNRPDSDTRRHALLEVSRLVDRIRIMPLPGRGKVDIDLTPHLPALAALAMNPFWEFEQSAEDPCP